MEKFSERFYLVWLVHILKKKIAMNPKFHD